LGSVRAETRRQHGLELAIKSGPRSNTRTKEVARHSGTSRYEPEVEAGVVEAAGVLLLLSLEVDAGLLSFAPLPDSALESDLESDLAALSAPELSLDEPLSDEPLFEA
jgi:hypothetical protein